MSILRALSLGGLLGLTLFTPLFAAESLVIEAPLDYQVIQRSSRSEGTIHFVARGERTTKLEVRLVDPNQKSEAVWREVKSPHAERNSTAQIWKTEIAAPAGGWYRLEVRAMDGANVVAQKTVEHVGVGEVFVIAGQSNSTNYGAEKLKTETGLVATFDGQTWRPGNDPQPGVQDGSNQGSFLPALGDLLAKKYGVPVGVASTGAGATSVRQWLPQGEPIARLPTIQAHVKEIAPGKWEATGELYAGLYKRCTQLGPHGLRAILWHQGESDAGQARSGYPAERQISGDDYQKYLELVIRRSRKDAAWEIPWFVALATYHSEQDHADEEFRSAQRAVCEKGLAQLGADTDQLRAEFRSGVHFNARGQREHGKLWAEKISAWLDRELAKGGSVP